MYRINRQTNSFIWQRRDEKKSSHIKYEVLYTYFVESFKDSRDRDFEDWNKLEDFKVGRNCYNIIQLYKHVFSFWEKAQNQVK